MKLVRCQLRWRMENEPRGTHIEVHALRAAVAAHTSCRSRKARDVFCVFAAVRPRVTWVR